MGLSRPFRMQTSTVWIVVFCAALASILPASAQDAGDEVTPEVQKLYAEARTAQQQGHPEVAIAKYRAMLKLAPHLGPAYNNLGMLYFDRRDYKDAAQTLEKGLAVDPNMGTASAMLGISYYKLGRNGESRAALEKALAANPADDRAEITLARVLILLNQPDDATARLKSYLNRNPKDQQAWYLLGKTYLRLSEDALGRINTIDPNSLTAHEVAGEIDESMHNYDGALAEYKKAVDLGPNEPGTHFHMGNTFWQLGKWESANEEFEAELRNDPDNCTTQWKLGNSMLAANLPAKDALPHLEKAIERCPDLMQARVDRASVLIKLDKPADAVPDLLLAEKDSPAEPSIHFLLSKAYKALGKTDQAREEIETYGKLQREASEAVAARASDAIQIKSTAH
jgi:tetratricopeptide (TPR) repeat protein